MKTMKEGKTEKNWEHREPSEKILQPEIGIYLQFPMETTPREMQSSRRLIMSYVTMMRMTSSSLRWETLHQKSCRVKF